MIGEKPARVLFSGLTPGLAGVYQVNIEVPSGLDPGLYTLTISIGQSSPPGIVQVAVE